MFNPLAHKAKKNTNLIKVVIFMTTFFRRDFTKSRQVYDKNNNKKNIIVSDFDNQ